MLFVFSIMFRQLRPSGGRSYSLRVSWRQDAGRADAGALEAGCGQCGRKTWAEWTQDTGRRGGKLFLGSTVNITYISGKDNVHILRQGR